MTRDRDTGSVRSLLPDGSIEWRNKDGKYHREDGPAKEWPTGAKAWYRNGKLHREDGPAMEGPLGKGWYLNGKRHRENGPAIEYADGRKEWYLHGRELTADKFAAVRKKNADEIGQAFRTGLTDRGKVRRPLQLRTSGQTQPR